MANGSDKKQFNCGSVLKVDPIRFLSILNVH